MTTAVETSFTPDQFASAFPSGLEHHYWNVARNHLILQKVRQFGGGRVLDVGCGTGIVVDFLCQQGIDCTGVETAASVRVPPHLQNAITLGVPAQELPESFRQSVKIIVLGDVIEHLPEPSVFLKSLTAAFENLAGFIITVPARPELWSNYDEHYGHFRRYDLASSRLCLEEAGLKPVDIQYLFRLLYIPARLLLAAKGARSPKQRPPSRMMRPLHKLIGLALRVDAAIFPKVVPGTSILIAANPKEK